MDTIDDELELKREVTELLRKHLTGKCAKHSDKALEWVRTNIRTFVLTVAADLDFFAREVVPIGEKMLEQGTEKAKD